METMEEKLERLKKERGKLDDFLVENKEEYDEDFRMAHAEIVGDPAGFKQTIRGISVDYQIDKGKRMSRGEFKKFVERRAMRNKNLVVLDSLAGQKAQQAVDRGQVRGEEVEDGMLLITKYLDVKGQQKKIGKEIKGLEAAIKKKKPQKLSSRDLEELRQELKELKKDHEENKEFVKTTKKEIDEAYDENIKKPGLDGKIKKKDFLNKSLKLIASAKIITPKQAARTAEIQGATLDHGDVDKMNDLMRKYQSSLLATEQIPAQKNRITELETAIRKKERGMSPEQRKKLRQELEQELDGIEARLKRHEERAALVKKVLAEHGEAIGLAPAEGLMAAKAIGEWDRAAKEKMQIWKAFNEITLMEKHALKSDKHLLRMMEEEYNKIIQHPSIKTRHKDLAGQAMEVKNGVFPKEDMVKRVIEIAKTLPPGGITEMGKVLAAKHLRHHGDEFIALLQDVKERKERIKRLEMTGARNKPQAVKLDFEHPDRLHEKIAAPLRERRRGIKKRLKKL